MKKQTRWRKDWISLVIGLIVGVAFFLSTIGSMRAQEASKAMDLIDWNGGKFLYGTYYYPDHWPGKWEKDAQLMQEAGINLIKTGEGAWGTLEPEEGQFNFDWLDQSIAIFNRHGIKVILGTPSYSQPGWLWEKYPDVAATDKQGIRYRFGSRQNMNVLSPHYVEAVRRIVTAMAEHYKNHPGVLGFSIDNEIGGVMSYDPYTLEAFQKWCMRKYQTLDNLNKSWGTVFWGLHLSSWTQAPLPWNTIDSGGYNPSMALDFSRFHSESVRDFVAFQADILRRIAPDKALTHNGMGMFDMVDYHQLFEPLDYVAYDHYPPQAAQSFTDHFPTDLGCDLMRACKKNQNFMVMEEQMGMGAWETYGQHLPAFQLDRIWSYQAIAHGADAINYYRWRQCPYGTEQQVVSILNWDDYVGESYQVVAQMGHELPKITDLLHGSKVVSPAAVLISPETRWAFHIQPHAKEFDYDRQTLRFYRALRQSRVNVDVAFPGSDFSPYKLIVAPSLLVVDSGLASKLDAFVKNGGTLVLSYLSGFRDENNWNTQQTLPGLLRKMAGIDIHYFDPQTSQEQEILGPGGKRYPARVWFDILEPSSAKSLATYTKGFYAGKAAVTENVYGAGRVYYVGTETSSQDFYQQLVGSALERAGIARGPFVPEGLQVAEREKAGKQIIFVLNYTGETQKVPMGKALRDALNGEMQPVEISLAPYGVKILTNP
ncbi:MAG TPA: beta-galactosidase [Terriglobia bacterium]|nr:beta-galactosidase [Terriglobia bacterium]